MEYQNRRIWFSRMVIYDSQDMDSGESGADRPVTDEEYEQLTMETEN